jgi:transposase
VLPSREQLLTLSKEEIVDLFFTTVAALTKQNELLTAQIVALTAQVAALKSEVAALKLQLREKNGPQAPFSKGKRVAKPKPPGRRKGQGLFKHRDAPQYRATDQIEEVDASLGIDQRQCPECAVPLSIHQEQASVIDVPPQPVRKITRINVEVGVCPRCGKKVRATHERLTPRQSGATAHQLGPQIKAQALALHYLHGVPMRKVPAILEQSTGIQITQSAINQLACQLTAPGAVLDKLYHQLRKDVSTSAVVNTDDTGWRINAVSAHLMGFFTREIAFYQIRSQHRHQEVMQVLGETFAGKLGTDRGSSYEAKPLNAWQQQKCLSHLLKNCSKVHERKVGRGRGREFTAKLMALLRESIALWQEHRSGKLDPAAYRERGDTLTERLGEQLRERKVSAPDNQRLLDGIGEQYRRGRVTLFLKHPEIEPTNNRAERGLRPAVIARKVSQCSKNEQGSRAYATLKTVFCTLAMRTKDAVGAFVELLQGNPMPKPTTVR